jgi:hypothetical protein
MSRRFCETWERESCNSLGPGLRLSRCVTTTNKDAPSQACPERGKPVVECTARVGRTFLSDKTRDNLLCLQDSDYEHIRQILVSGHGFSRAEESE